MVELAATRTESGSILTVTSESEDDEPPCRSDRVEQPYLPTPFGGKREMKTGVIQQNRRWVQPVIATRL